MSMRRSRTEPFLRMRRVAKDTCPPPSTRSRTALYSAVSSSGRNGGCCPVTSAADQPNIRSAAGFHTVTARSAPTAMMASAAHWMTARAAASGGGRPGPRSLRANP